MKGTYQAPALRPAGTFQEVTEGHGYKGKMKWKKKFYGFGFGRKFGGFHKKYDY